MDKDRRSHPARTQIVAGAATLAFGLSAGITGAALAGAPGGAGTSTAELTTRAADLPDDAEDYGQATYEAWIAGDTASLEELGGAWIAHFLGSRPAEGEDPGAAPSCETTGRSTWCTWPLTDGTQLALQVDNEFADRGLAEAVIGAEFRTGDGVGVWPVTSQEEADNSQAGVDEGHQPWMADAGTVVTFYAENVLGWADPTVTGEDTGSFTFTESTSGISGYAQLGQPAREGDGGIWTITTVGTGNPAAEDPRDPDDPPPTTAPPTTGPPSTSPVTTPTTTVPDQDPDTPPPPAVEGEPRLTG